MQPGKRPLSFLLPTVVRPAEGLCGTYLALGANGAARGLSGLTQVRFPQVGLSWPGVKL